MQTEARESPMATGILGGALVLLIACLSAASLPAQPSTSSQEYVGSDVEADHQEGEGDVVRKYKLASLLFVLAGVWGWLAFMSRGVIRVINLAMSVYLLSLALPALQVIPIHYLGWEAAWHSLRSLNRAGGAANLLFVGTYVCVVARRHLVSRPPWQPVFSATATIGAVCMMASIILLIVKFEGRVNVGLMGPGYVIPTSFSMTGKPNVVFYLGAVAWIVAGGLLVLGVGRLTSAQDSDSPWFRMRKWRAAGTDDSGAGRVSEADPGDRRSQVIAAKFGMTLACVTAALFAAVQLVTFMIPPLSEFSAADNAFVNFAEVAYFSLVVTGPVAFVCCLIGLPRDSAVRGLIVVVSTCGCLFVFPPRALLFMTGLSFPL